MHIIMNDTAIKTLDHVRQFLNGLGPLEFRIDAKAARYPWIQATLRRGSLLNGLMKKFN